MKNNLFKKVSAAALAAVMALTFAPAASLTAFANMNVTGQNEIYSADAVIDAPGTYTVTTTAAVTAVISGSAARGTYIFDISKCNGGDGFTLEFNARTSTAVKVIIKGSKGVSGKEWYYGKFAGVTTGQTCQVADDDHTFGTEGDRRSVEFEGDIEIDDQYKSAEKYDPGFGGNPVAKFDGDVDYYLGNGIINDMVDVDKTNITALNGAVDIKSLRADTQAVIGNDASAGTSLTAATKDKVSLTKIEKEYTYKYWTDDPYRINGLTGVYTNDAYYAGYALAEDAIKALDAHSTTGTALMVRYGGKRDITGYNGNSYECRITVDVKGDESWKDKTVSPYPEDNREDGFWDHGMTYYTMDPTSFTNSADGIALLDGKAYVVDDHTDRWAELDKEADEASETIAILRGTEASATAGNANAYNTFVNNNGVKVTAPVDESVFSEDQDYVLGKDHGTDRTFYVVGSARTTNQDGSLKEVDKTVRGTKYTLKTLNVSQVASGSGLLFSEINDKVVLERANGIGYYHATDINPTVGNSDDVTVFGNTKEITASFENLFKNTKQGIFTVQKALKSGDVYASKEIKTVVSGVDPDIKITGELNADVTETAADGSKTWDVNTDTAKEMSQTVAYRMYRKSGEHVYTINPAEVKMLEAAGWVNEGKAFTVNSVASGKGTPIYRVYNKNGGGMHFYTASAAEKDMLLANGWTEGKVVFYGADKATGIPVYRTYNTGSNNGEHNYTTNIAESEMNVQAGWRAEGVAFYVFK